MATGTLTVTPVPAASRLPHETRLLVKLGETLVGTISRVTPTRTTKTPWQAHRAIGGGFSFLGSFWGAAGRREALTAVLLAAEAARVGA